MSDFEHILIGRDGKMRTTGLYRQGFPQLFWKTLQSFGCTDPPLYVGQEFSEEGQRRCKVKVMIPHHPTRADWEPWKVTAIGTEYDETVNKAAQQALTEFCEKHKEEMGENPAVVFPLRNPGDSVWQRNLRAILRALPAGQREYMESSLQYSMFSQDQYLNKCFYATLDRMTLIQAGKRERSMAERIRQLAPEGHARDMHMEEMMQQIQALGQQIQAKDQQLQTKDQAFAQVVAVKDGRIAELEQALAASQEEAQHAQQLAGFFEHQFDHANDELHALMAAQQQQQEEEEEEEEDPEEIEGVSGLETEEVQQDVDAASDADSVVGPMQ